MSIATASFETCSNSFPIAAVDTIDATRRKRLEMLIDRYGFIAALNLAIGVDRTDATLSQIRTQAPHSRTGKPRAMGDEKAREIEERLGLERGWMDTPPTHSELNPDDRISRALLVMEKMTPYQLDQAVRVLATLAEPPRELKNGTED